MSTSSTFTGISIDGTTIPLAAIKGVKRSFNVLDGPHTGRMVGTGRMERDIIGTFYNYTVLFDSRQLTDTQYNTLYNLLSAPTASHTVTLPYNSGSITFQAYCTQGEDEVIWAKPGGRASIRWGNLEIHFIAMKAERT